MKSFIDVKMGGTIASDIDVQTIGGSQCAKFSIVVDRKNAAKLKEDGKQSADFFSCELWDSKGSRIKYLTDTCRKGSLILIISSEIRMDEVVTEADGGVKKKIYPKIIINDFTDVARSRGNEE